MISMLAGAVLLLLVPTLLAYAVTAIEFVASRDRTEQLARIPMDERTGALAGLLIVAACLWIGG